MTERVPRPPVAPPLGGGRAGRSPLVLLLAVAAALLVASPVSAATVAPVVTSAPSSPAAVSPTTSLLSMINTDRASLGLRPFRYDPVIAGLATERAQKLADLGILDHQAPGDIGAGLVAAGVHWTSYAEDIGWSSLPLGPGAVSMLYGMWKASPEHWAAIVSPNLNYIGIGFGRRPQNGATYASLLFAETADRTPPVVAMMSSRRATMSTGVSLTWAWRGADVLLQTHTSGLRDFRVELRVDLGPWRTVWASTSRTSLTLTSRPRGHSYSIRVRARDRAGNVSAWSHPRRIVVS